MKLPRFLHKAYADFFGYFWKPCPLCTKEFGGHEYSGAGINQEWLACGANSYLFGDGTIIPVGPTNVIVCKNCVQLATTINVFWMLHNNS